jgi:hypothetical protein
MGCGKLLTTPPLLGDRFDQAMRGLDNRELGDFQDGQVQFRKSFTIAEGLGPIFNNVSCASCHSGDGRGTTQNILVRFSRGTDLVPGEGGPQIQDRAIPGAVAEHLPAGVDVSLRMPPPVFGVGFIEAITDSSILSHADPSDADGDGISGRANMVTAPAFVPPGQPGGGAGTHVGRFGRKAQVSSLFQQTVTAYSQDMGITSDALPVENVNPLTPPGLPNPDRANDPEVGGQQVNDVCSTCGCQRAHAGRLDGSWRLGQTLFAGSARVPHPVMHTGPHEIDAVANRDVTIYPRSSTTSATRWRQSTRRRRRRARASAAAHRACGSRRIHQRHVLLMRRSRARWTRRSGSTEERPPPP